MDRRSLLQVTHRLGCSAHAPPADSFSFRRRPEGRGVHSAADVRLFVPRDDRLQHDPAAHAIESDPEPGCGQRPLGHPRLGPDHRRADGRLHQDGRRAAAPLGAADHAGPDGGSDGRLLVPVPHRRGLGLGRLLRLGRTARHPPHQPVLDARQRHLRSASGEAPVRIRRRRRHARRDDWLRLDRADHPVGRHQRTAAVERRRPDPVHGRRRDGARPGTGRRQRRGRRRRRARRHDGQGGGAAARVAPDSDHRTHHQLRVHWRGHPRPAGQHGDGNLQGRRPGRLDRRLPGADPLLHLIGRVRHPGLDHAAHSSLPGHRVRAVDAADQPDASPRR